MARSRKKTEFKIGNTEAEKWTPETVMPILGNILNGAKNGDYIWIGDALIENDLYKDIWAYWSEKFKNDSTVFRTIKKIDTIFESLLFKGALDGTHVPSVAIFGLKNNHLWKDKTETDLTTKGESINNFNIATLYDPTDIDETT